jgi:D-amino peptidase
MRIYLSVDMEGLAGVAHPHQVSFGPGVDRVDYDRSRALMAAEANAAIEAAFDTGADDVVVNDSHWHMRNLRAEDLDPRARLLIGDKPFSMTQDVDDGPDDAYDAAAFVGYHAGAGHATGVIGHTYSSAVVAGVRVNGAPHNEAAVNAIRLGHHGIPVVLVTGDDALADEIAPILPWTERVVVKRALGYSTADGLSPSAAADAIRAGMRAALARMAEMEPYRPSLPLRSEIEFRLPVHAAFAAVLPEIERIGPRSVAFDATDGESFFRRFLAAFRLAGSGTL